MEGTLETSEASASFAKLAWISKEWRQSSKLLEPRSFNVCKNATAPIIAMLGHSEIDMEVSDAGMETIESDDCREISRDDRDTNSVLVTTQERARFSCKDRQNFMFIDSFT